MGSSDANAEWKGEKPQHALTLPTYWIGKTEVTNAQFRPFVEGDGYTNREYWTEAGWTWRQAQHDFEQALATSREIGDRLGTANALCHLGEALWAQDKAEQAKATLREAREISAQIQSQAGQFLALKTLFAIAKAKGETIVAKEYQVAYEQVRHAKR